MWLIPSPAPCPPSHSPCPPLVSMHSFVSSPFGPRWGSFHRGVDVAAEEGEPIRAARSGVVTHVGEMDVYGNLVTLAHEAGFTTHYAHCSKMVVQAGQRVRAGQVVALVGNTGRSMGPHLHFE
ncbi:unnamed protein product, partial [Closterium sp. NIES-54]